MIWQRGEKLVFELYFIIFLDCEQSLLFPLSSLSRGKTTRTPARGNLGKEKQRFRAPVFAMSFRGSTNARGKRGTARSLLYFRIENEVV